MQLRLRQVRSRWCSEDAFSKGVPPRISRKVSFPPPRCGHGLDDEMEQTPPQLSTKPQTFVSMLLLLWHLNHTPSAVQASKPINIRLWRKIAEKIQQHQWLRSCIDERPNTNKLAFKKRIQESFRPFQGDVVTRQPQAPESLVLEGESRQRGRIFHKFLRHDARAQHLKVPTFPYPIECCLQALFGCVRPQRSPIH